MKIVVVEDQQIILKGIVRMIEHCEPTAQIFPYSSAREALKDILAIAPDVTFTDIIMGGMDGLAFIREATARKATGRFVIISGYANFSYAQEAINLGVNAYLLKPINRRQLEQILADVRKSAPTRPEESRYSALVQHALALIQAWCQEPISVSRLAQELHVVPNYLSNLVGRETGVSLSELIRAAQMKQVELWLRTTDMYLYEIAEKLGYHDVKYFSRLFRTYYHDTPLHYRKIKKENPNDEENR